MNETPDMIDKEESQSLTLTIFNQPKGFLESLEFCRFLESPCEGCGSPLHSLMVAKTMKRTRSGGRKVYEFQCHVVDHSNLYDRNKQYPSDELNIKFSLIAKEYTKDCKYDIDVANNRIPLHFRTEEKNGFLDTFLLEIRQLCLEHSRKSPESRSDN